MENLSIYNKVREVPKEALKPIEGGRLKGKSDINPMWRIKTLTEQFGMCGFGWRYEIVSERLEKGANDEIAAFVQINLFVKVEKEWSAPIPGTGGSAFITKEKSGLYTSDECFKMALTDAISVACKALGVGADVYWNKDKTKYDQREPNGTPKNDIPDEKQVLREKYLQIINDQHIFSDDEREKYKPGNWSIKAYQDAIAKVSVMKDEREFALYEKHEHELS